MKIAKMLVSESLLISRLNLPEGTIIISVEKDRLVPGIWFVIHHDDLRDIGEIEGIPEIRPQVIDGIFRWYEHGKAKGT